MSETGKIPLIEDVQIEFAYIFESKGVLLELMGVFYRYIRSVST